MKKQIWDDTREVINGFDWCKEGTFYVCMCARCVCGCVFALQIGIFFVELLLLQTQQLKEYQNKYLQHYSLLQALLYK